MTDSASGSPDLSAAKGALLKERDELIRQRESIEGRDEAQSIAEESGELSDYGDHPADTATATFEREKDLALVNTLERLLSKVDRALDKIKEKSYGRCDRCGAEIGVGRLEAMPSATLCLGCQDVEDGL